MTPSMKSLVRYWVTTDDGYTVSVSAQSHRQARMIHEAATGKRVVKVHRPSADHPAPHDGYFVGREPN